MILNFHSTNAYDKYCKCVSELTNIFPYIPTYVLELLLREKMQ